MRKNLSYFLILTFVFSFLGCTTKKTLTTIPLAAPVSEEIVDDVSMLDQDSLYQSGLATQDSLISAYFEQQINTYKPSATREQDLLHIKLDLKFDWQQQRVLGKAWLTLKPFFYSSDVVMLDAKGFTIAAVTLADKNIPLKYDYDNKVLTIHLDKTYEPTEEYKLFIDYIAKPSERQDVAGSAAITSNQGLFFINHDGKDKDKPMQIWTQGETEHNSRWFPTIDKPNERCTQEMLLTVEDKFKTLSNGLLKSSTKNSDGTRSDYWVMDMPHAPYLFMVAVGEYSIVKDTWEGKDILYYVEPEYEQDARAIFANTTEMLQFFSDKLGVKYPWQKYAEIVVRDYVSGAMENTTAVIFGEFVQKHKNELSGVGNDLVVAHELFHHWFGDYVTCESWSNLTLNEGFANYSEYLWFEHKYGADEANAHLVNEQQGYFASARGGVHPLIFYHYADKEDMFDAHSYNKGGCVLHMLRNYLGDKAFFTALNRYLTKNAFTAVEADELRQAFEDVSGKDLKWFFDQWFLSAGHPKLAVKTYYDTNTGEAVVQLKQDQESFVEPPIFILPMAVDIYLEDSGTPTRQQIMMTKKEETFRFKTNKRPKLINVDADKVLLCEKFEEKSTEEWIFQYKHAKNYIDRYQALQGLQIDNNQEVIKLFREALQDKHPTLRALAQEALDLRTDATEINEMQMLALSDASEKVRIKAIQILSKKNDAAALQILEKIIIDEPAPTICKEAILAHLKLAPEKTVALVKPFENSTSAIVLSAVAQVYAANPNLAYIPFFEHNWQRTKDYAAIEFFSQYQRLITALPEVNKLDKMTFLQQIATDTTQHAWIRFGAAKAIKDTLVWLEENKSDSQSIAVLQAMVNHIKTNEANPQLHELYNSVL